MPEKEGDYGKGVYALQSWRSRPAADVRHWAPYLPEVHLTIGRDEHGSGITITAWEPTLGEFAAYRTLWHRRWREPIESTQEALQVAARGLAAALAELFEPTDD